MVRYPPRQHLGDWRVPVPCGKRLLAVAEYRESEYVAAGSRTASRDSAAVCGPFSVATVRRVALIARHLFRRPNSAAAVIGTLVGESVGHQWRARRLAGVRLLRRHLHQINHGQRPAIHCGNWRCKRWSRWLSRNHQRPHVSTRFGRLDGSCRAPRSQLR